MLFGTMFRKSSGKMYVYKRHSKLKNGWQTETKEIMQSKNLFKTWRERRALFEQGYYLSGIYVGKDGEWRALKSFSTRNF